MLKFRDYWLHKDRNETHMALILREAAAEVFTHDSEAPMSEPVYIWRSGHVDLDVCPYSQQGGPALTWRRWLVSINGIRGFTLAYPGLDCVFEVHVNEVVKGKKEEFYLGFGVFSDFSQARAG
jgi:hypothetical protein